MITVDDYKTDLLKQHQSFSPYEDNGGTIVAIAGSNFAVIGSDTRLSSGYIIQSRNQTKLFKLSDKTVLGSCGCWCDVISFTQLLNTRMKMYMHDHNKIMGTQAVSQLIVSLLYYKRFFPYYTFNVLAGLDEEGKGVVYSYDSIGHKGTKTYESAGASNQLIQPLLDNQVGRKNIESRAPPPDMSLERALAIVKDSFTAAAERNINTGDAVVINIITRDGIKEEIFPLRKD